MLQRVRISGQQLETLCLYGCNSVDSIQIDAPSLPLFKLGIGKIPFLGLESVSCPMDIKYVLGVEYGKVDSSWFLELGQFLGDSQQRKYLTLDCTYENKVCFDIEELGQVAISPLIIIDHLKITSFHFDGSFDCEALIDGLLWSCHPMAISVLPGSTFQNICVKVLCQKLLHKEQPSCCSSSYLKCWRRDLKAAKVESFGHIEVERLLHLPQLETWSSLTINEEVRFNLQ